MTEFEMEGGMTVYRLAGREKPDQHTHICIKRKSSEIWIGEGFCTVMAGPCAIESREGFVELARLLKDSGVGILRGGLFKPRTSPYSFRGMAAAGLEILSEVREGMGMAVVSEIMDIRDLEPLYDRVDILQVGSRNMQNYTLLEELGKTDKPVLLKRGLAATIEEWLLAAEYILCRGNLQVILCERGIRTFEGYTRNTFDISAIPLIKELSHLPVIADPSHATGSRSLVSPVARAAVAAGADGIMVEVHQDPSSALSDGRQSLTPGRFSRLYREIGDLACLYQKQIN